MLTKRLFFLFASFSSAAFAQTEPTPAPEQTVAAAVSAGFNSADTAWMLTATVLVLLMTLPGIVLFYAGLMRAKNALSLAAQALAATALITLVWAIAGYSLAFTADSPWLGGIDRMMAQGLGAPGAAGHEMAKNIPNRCFSCSNSPSP